MVANWIGMYTDGMGLVRGCDGGEWHGIDGMTSRDWLSRFDGIMICSVDWIVD